MSEVVVASQQSWWVNISRIQNIGIQGLSGFGKVPLQWSLDCIEKSCSMQRDQ